MRTRATFSLLVVLLVGGCDRSSAEPPHAIARTSAIDPASVTTIETPSSLRGLPVGPPDANGRPSVVPCATCHELPDAGRPLPSSTRGIAGPHRGLTFDHGGLVCASCHDATDRAALHLADGRSVPLVDAMRLCSQCHGPQRRAYDHGAHGGMRGHWDVEEGPRVRNHCVACHDPHAPRFGSFEPMPAPRDRFLPHGEGASHE